MYSKNQRRAALIGVILLVLLLLATLITAIFNFDGEGKLFKAFLFATIAVPILIWVYIWLYGAITQKRTIASVFPEIEGLEEAKEHQLQEMLSGENPDIESTDKEAFQNEDNKKEAH